MAVTDTVQRVLGVGATLGEGPLWHEDALWFVDIKQCQVHRFDPTTNAHRTWPAPAQIGWVQPMADGGMLAGLQTGLHRFDPDSGAFTFVVAPEPDLPGNRLNDSCVDPSGRLWFGSMDDAETLPSGRIYRADAAAIVPVVGDIVITNGPAISGDGRTLYHCDTLGGRIHACTVAEDGSLEDQQVFAHVDVGVDGHPDGPIVDADGHVWVAFFSGWCVRRYAPDGRQVAEVPLPVANVTKITIGGPDGRTAYATTASKGLSDRDREGQPCAGDIFAFDAGVTGQPAHRIARLP